MWRRMISCEKTWADLKKLFSKECRDTHELQLINATQSGFHGSNMAITTKCGIAEALEELAMAKNSEKYVHTQLTSTIKRMSETNKFLT